MAQFCGIFLFPANYLYLCIISTLLFHCTKLWFIARLIQERLKIHSLVYHFIYVYFYALCATYQFIPF
jgi:hypothetical protein